MIIGVLDCAHKDCKKHTYVIILCVVHSVLNKSIVVSPHRSHSTRRARILWQCRESCRYDRKQSGYGGQTKTVFIRRCVAKYLS